MATILFIGPKDKLDLVGKLATQHAVRHVCDEGLALRDVYLTGLDDERLRKIQQPRYDLILYDPKAFFDKANPTLGGEIFSKGFLDYLERVANVPVVVLGEEQKAIQIRVGQPSDISQLRSIIDFSLN